ncbi:glutamate-ammonia-ligase adenylyltransferase [Salinihabitans flavidus]|uniref:Glutamate-ammonia-ligase adenylyltransferase n=1 Tax=Salinihabitans flavidus TaxID=569882 RepID=A0A1H8QFD2_9RHOB|nr:glutamine-synthetase adenylyltransferase [Salinihabitans flavidus]SEO52922.1 glutamate-ammonia-ligase adenylyltransferase [Salinihabitans flavidus]
MSIESRITRLPRAFEPDRADEARERVPALSGDAAALIGGAAGSSPYLAGLIAKEADWMPEAFDAPEESLDAVFEALRQGAPDRRAEDLRAAKRRVALLTALADLGGIWPLEEVTRRLTAFADLAVQLALEATVGTEIRRGKLPGAREEDIAQAGGMVALAMGKMGADELNYSSDIDLICLFDETRYDRDDYHDARASLVRATRRMAAMLSDLTGEGYVFRTDLRLRPDPSVTPVCMTMEAAERYYESLGRTWERAAYIKARAAAGDIAAGEGFLETLRPFVWRRHLDFAAIDDAHNMRLRIRAHKGTGGAIALEGHDMKLGRGGIREIEFFTQTRQLIAGGRDAELRLRGTVPALARLAEKGWVPEEAAEVLSRHYRAHREVEHRLQMINDAQTHNLPKSAEGFERLACLMGTDAAALRKEVAGRLEEVHALTESFFAPDTAPSEEPDLPEIDGDVVQRWYSYPALRSGRAVEIFKRLRPELLGRLARTARPEESLAALDGFLAGLPAGVQVFSLFEANPQLIDLLVDIVGTAPKLARHLSRNPQVFDAVIGGDFFAPWPGLEVLCADLSDVMGREEDYERKLDAARRWAREWHFRIGVHHLRGLIGADEAGAQYADLAESCLAALWPEVVAKFAEKHGPAPGHGAMVLGMGSLGVRRLHARSDLDLIVIYDADGVEQSEGRRPLAARTYYARLTQALVTAMTAPMAEGRLYEVDMRLRPSGTQGPVATSLASFRDYQLNQAWTWEHLALTRARAVAGQPELMQQVEAFRAEILTRPCDAGRVRRDWQEMRARIAAARAPAGIWDAKIGAGRLQDVELAAQAASLLSGQGARTVRDAFADAVEAGILEQTQRVALEESYELCWTVQVVSRLLSESALDPEAIGEGGRAFLLRETGAETLEELEGALEGRIERAERVIGAMLKGAGDDGRSE